MVSETEITASQDRSTNFSMINHLTWFFQSSTAGAM